LSTVSGTPENATSPQPHLPVRRRGIEWTVYSLVVAVALLAFAVGAALRAWYLFHQPTNSDEATVGLMAIQILHGHVSAFYWGQAYGGAEPYVVAALFAVFGHQALLVTGTATGLSALAALLFWRIALRAVDDRLLALLAAALFWVGSQVALWNSTIEYGFRGVTMCCGLASLLVALRIVEGNVRPREFVGLGLLIGVGWWSSPEVAYFLVPVALLLVAPIWNGCRTGPARVWLARSALIVGAAAAGALPWSWANVDSGFRSLRHAAFMVPPDTPGYAGRLKLFFQFSFPLLVDLRVPETGRWMHGPTVTVVLLVVLLAALVASLVLMVRQGATGRAIAGGTVLFPLVLAISPATWFQADGRYVGYLLPLLVIDLCVGLAESMRLLRSRAQPARSLSRVVLAGLVALAALLTIDSFSRFHHYVDGSDSFTSGWVDPNGPTLRAVHLLEAGGVHDGYADYWVAYKVDLLSNTTLRITDVPTDVDRWPALARQVQKASTPAWLFVSPNSVARNQFAQNAHIQGPDGLPVAAFVAALDRMGVPYRVVNAGLVQAVIPARAVSPQQVGLP
jgi:hypothetical protein